MYNWQQTDWRHFRYEAEKYTSYLLEFIELVGESVGSYLYQNICTFLNKLTQFKHFLLKLYKFVQKMTEK
jgi:hypothetical protein